MTCCLGRKCKNSMLFWKIFNSYVYVSVDNGTMKNCGRHFTCGVCDLKNIVKNCKKVITFWLYQYIFSNLEIYILNFLLNFHCFIIHRNVMVGIDYFPKMTKFLMFSAETTSHEFRLNITLRSLCDAAVITLAGNAARRGRPSV